jgi:hypothetical protein
VASWKAAVLLDALAGLTLAEKDGDRDRNSAAQEALVKDSPGYIFDVALEAKVGGKWVRWTERRWLVQSVALARSQRQQLDRRLHQAQEQLGQLCQRKQGKKRLTAEQLQAAVVDP